VNARTGWRMLPLLVAAASGIPIVIRVHSESLLGFRIDHVHIVHVRCPSERASERIAEDAAQGVSIVDNSAVTAHATRSGSDTRSRSDRRVYLAFLDATFRCQRIAGHEKIGTHSSSNRSTPLVFARDSTREFARGVPAFKSRANSQLHVTRCGRCCGRSIASRRYTASLSETLHFPSHPFDRTYDLSHRNVRSRSNSSYRRARSPTRSPRFERCLGITAEVTNSAMHASLDLRLMASSKIPLHFDNEPRRRLLLFSSFPAALSICRRLSRGYPFRQPFHAPRCVTMARCCNDRGIAERYSRGAKFELILSLRSFLRSSEHYSPMYRNAHGEYRSARDVP